TPLK
ncbi:amidohydrolase family protein, partial [Vibrio parahaemolyticus V-223/04]